MGLQPILSVIQPVAIDSMLNKNGLKDVMCKQGLTLSAVQERWKGEVQAWPTEICWYSRIKWCYLGYSN